MTTSDYQLSELCFFRAIELPAAQRADFVNEELADSPLIRDRVLALLNNHSESNGKDFILDRTPDVKDLSGVGEQVGDRIGPYRLLEQIGEGGMGIVYMAEQLEGIRRKVALKIIKLGMDTRQVVARFEAERQAMALFDHPNIARVLDAGSTESGRPFFVMELVRGSNITDFINGHKLPLTERLQLFIAICNAVQHAHQKGIIHRDLKPSNVLVTQFDGTPVPKVIDFGIAKAIGQNLTDKTLFTRYSAMVGTPQYMSPEQAEMTGIDIDTRSDIYSLGVILYELITGTTPLKKEAVSKLNPLAIYETLRDADIETPSLRIAKTAESAPLKVAAEVRSGRIKNELDWVVMKALSRDRTERYATANELATDVQHYMNGDPVLAAPPARFYRLRSYANKHRSTFIAAAIVSALLLISTIVSSVLAINSGRLNTKLKRALGNAETNLQRAETAEKELRETNERQLFDSAHSMAFEKFMTVFGNEYAGLVEEDLDETAVNVDVTPVENFEIDDVHGFEALELDDAEFENEGFFCLFFDWNWLLEFKQSEQLEPSLVRLKATFDGMDSESKEVSRHYASVVGDDAGWYPDSESHEHSPQCLEMQAKIKSKMKDVRPRFFRLIVAEYRRVFGENDPRVAEGLTLLGASLMEANSLNEAEAHLRESIALSGSENSSVQKALLEKINLLKKQAN